MSGALVFDTEEVLGFMRQHLPGLPRVEGATAIGWKEDGALRAGVYYEGFNGHNIWMHVAAEPGARWMRREYLHACFAYPFEVCKVRRVSGWVEASNTQACEFDEHLGFKPEALLKGAASDGGDVVLYVMWRDDCRFLKGVSDG